MFSASSLLHGETCGFTLTHYYDSEPAHCSTGRPVALLWHIIMIQSQLTVPRVDMWLHSVTLSWFRASSLLRGWTCGFTLTHYHDSEPAHCSAGRHVAPLYHIIMIPTQPVFVLTLYCCVFSRDATHTNFIVFCLTRPGLEKYDLPYSRRGR